MSFVTKPMPIEVCGCGAQLYSCASSLTGSEQERLSFRVAHASCAKREEPTLQWVRIDPEGPGLHAPKKAGDVGWDLEAAEEVLLIPNQQYDVATNVRVQLPPDCWGEIRARSSIARMGLQVDAGVLDNGYTGPLLVLLRNMNRRPGDNNNCDWIGRVKVEEGQRIAQLVLHRACWARGLEVDEIPDDPRRGSSGFGSTGR